MQIGFSLSVLVGLLFVSGFTHGQSIAVATWGHDESYHPSPQQENWLKETAPKLNQKIIALIREPKESIRISLAIAKDGTTKQVDKRVELNWIDQQILLIEDRLTPIAQRIMREYYGYSLEHFRNHQDSKEVAEEKFKLDSREFIMDRIHDAPDLVNVFSHLRNLDRFLESVYFDQAAILNRL